jgi:hypothetical protein
MVDHREAMTSERVECASHGPRAVTFTCLHVAAGEGLGFCFDPESTAPWPDATCDACAAERPWSEETELARIRLLCAGCWEDAFARNTRVAPADDEEWLREACRSASSRQERWLEKFPILSASRYRYCFDGDEAWLGFGEDPRFDVLCDAQIVGSWSRRSGTWLWGWANDWWEPRLTMGIIPVKRFGESRGLPRLWRGGFEADEDLALHLARGAMSLLPDVDGIYRAPTDHGSLFLAASRTRLAS